MENIILLTYDSLRADHCGHHGYNRDTTPNLDQLADEGVSFMNAVSVASRTNPSMASTFTGEPMTFRESVSNPEVARYHLSRYGTLAEHLSDMGYTTGAFCPNAYASSYYGFDRGFDHFEDFLFSNESYQTIFEEHLDDSGIYGTIRNLRNFVRREEVFRTWDRYIDQIREWTEQQEQPYFLWIFSLDTHFPFLTPRSERKYTNMFDQYYYNWISNKVIDQANPDLSARTWEKMVDIYDDSIQFADKLIPELQSRLSADDPVIIAHSDHGEAFGEHGMFGHFYPAQYEENIHVPTVAWSSDCDSMTVSQPFSLLDMPEYIIQGATKGNLTNPPTQSAAILSDYDGRRERNVIAARSADTKYMFEESPETTTEGYYRLETRDGGDVQEIKMDRGPDVLRKKVVRRNQHEQEHLSIKNACSNLDITSSEE